MSINLYRGKRKDNGEWVIGAALPHDNNGAVTIFRQNQGDGALEGFEVVPETVGQATGYDSYFVGDIIKSEQDGMIGVIRFGEYQTTNSGNGECHLGFSIEWYGKYSDIIRRDLGWWVKAANKDINILGNIHDNPELLEVE
jgi:hypothetical protein